MKLFRIQNRLAEILSNGLAPFAKRDPEIELDSI